MADSWPSPLASSGLVGLKWDLGIWAKRQAILVGMPTGLHVEKHWYCEERKRWHHVNGGFIRAKYWLSLCMEHNRALSWLLGATQRWMRQGVFPWTARVFQEARSAHWSEHPALTGHQSRLLGTFWTHSKSVLGLETYFSSSGWTRKEMYFFNGQRSSPGNASVCLFWEKTWIWTAPNDSPCFWCQCPWNVSAVHPMKELHLDDLAPSVGSPELSTLRGQSLPMALKSQLSFSHFHHWHPTNSQSVDSSTFHRDN